MHIIKRCCSLSLKRNIFKRYYHNSNLVDILQGKVQEFQLHNHGLVRLLDVMPRLVHVDKTADHAITDAARVSYALGTKKSSKDQNLINRLYRDEHTSPFEMVEFKFLIRCPIFVLRQWIRHRTANVNEESGRYSIMVDQFYIPEKIRKQSIDNKQGSDGLVSEEAEKAFYEFLEKNQQIYQNYLSLLDLDVSRELARIGLPLNMYSSFYWKCDLHNLLHFLKLRIHPHAQLEIRDYANCIYDLIKPIVPYSCEAFKEYTLDSIKLSGKEIKAIKNDDYSHIDNKTELKSFMEKYNRLMK